jgi:copper chaperone CopZ
MKRKNIMKALTLLSTIAVLTFANPAFAEMDKMDHATMDHSTHAEMVMDGKADGEVIAKSGDAHVSVNGLVCDFCARALEKTFGKRDEVKGIDVNLETKIVTVNFNDGQSLDNDTLTQIITDSGYNVEGIHRVE